MELKLIQEESLVDGRVRSIAILCTKFDSYNLKSLYANINTTP